VVGPTNFPGPGCYELANGTGVGPPTGVGPWYIEVVAPMNTLNDAVRRYDSACTPPPPGVAEIGMTFVQLTDFAAMQAKCRSLEPGSNFMLQSTYVLDHDGVLGVNLCTGGVAPGDCLQPNFRPSSLSDLTYLGPINAAENAIDDGIPATIVDPPCSGRGTQRISIIDADTQAQADGLCMGLNLGPATNLLDAGYAPPNLGTSPGTLYRCGDPLP
jgi:hypothetical protein